MILCQEGLKAFGPKLPIEENVKVPRIPTLKIAFQRKLPRLLGNANVVWEKQPIYWWPPTDNWAWPVQNSEHRYGSQDGLCFGWGLGSGNLGYVLSHNSWHGSRIGVSWCLNLPQALDQMLLCSLLWAQPSMRRSRHVCRPRGRWCEGVRRRGSLRERPWMVCSRRPFRREGSLKERSVPCEIWRGAFL